MKKNKSARRNFIKLTSIGVGSLSLAPVIASAKEIFAQNGANRAEKKLHIICAGAHPGDPEFGCGGTYGKIYQRGPFSNLFISH